MTFVAIISFFFFFSNTPDIFDFSKKKKLIMPRPKTVSKARPKRGIDILERLVGSAVKRATLSAVRENGENGKNTRRRSKVGRSNKTTPTVGSTRSLVDRGTPRREKYRTITFRPSLEAYRQYAALTTNDRNLSPLLEDETVQAYLEILDRDSGLSTSRDSSLSIIRNERRVKTLCTVRTLYIIQYITRI